MNLLSCRYFLSLVLLSFSPGYAIAQIIPDSSLGTESSVVETKDNRETIDGGAIRDRNLFHSFQEFNVATGREAYFNNPDGINNIFSRVTGSNISQINGVLGVLGNANLYLINPNGILFGENARLDVNGSFFATTADSILFKNGIEFSAINPDAPPLLTIDIPLGLSFRDNPGNIINRSDFENKLDSEENTITGLEVNGGNTISLIGGDILLEQSGITSLGGKIELASVSLSGVVTINPDLSLSFPENIVKGNIDISDNSRVNVRSDGGGFITINAGDLIIEENSELTAGIEKEMGSLGTVAGDINLNSDRVIVNEGKILNQVLKKATGNAGNINIVARDLIQLEGVVLASNLDEETEGRAGNINLISSNIDINNQFEIFTNTKGKGNAGNITIIAKDTLSLDNRESSQGDRRQLLSQVQLGNNTLRNAGTIKLEASDIIINDSLIDANVKKNQSENNLINIGNAGIIEIKAADSLVINNSKLLSQIEANTQGSAGKIELKSLNIKLDDSRVNVNTLGTGNAGSIEIKANESLILSDKSQLRSQVILDAKGNAGNIKLNASYIKLDDSTVNVNTLGIGDAGIIDIQTEESLIIDNNSNLLSEVLQNAEGNAGIIFLESSTVKLNNSEIRIDTKGTGSTSKIGKIEIKARESITLDKNSKLSSEVLRNAEGDAGAIFLEANNITIKDKSRILTVNRQQGKSGNIRITTYKDLIIEDNSNLQSQIFNNSQGSAGDIFIDASNLTIKENSSLKSDTNSSGNGGNIVIKLEDTLTLDKSNINSGVNKGSSGDGGNINIYADKIFLQNGANLSSGTSGEGNAGKIILDTNFLSLDNFSYISSTTRETSQGKGGFIDIKADIISIANGSSINAFSDSDFDSGKINIIANNLELKQGGTIFSGANKKGNAGNITLNIAENIILDGSNIPEKSEEIKEREKTLQIDPILENIANRTGIIADTQISSGGNINIKAEFIVAKPDRNSDIIANAREGRGGKIEIEAKSIFGIREREENPQTNDIDASSEFGLSGRVSLEQPDIDPSNSLIEFTTEIINASQLIAQNVCTQTASSEFLNLGKGGLPQNPYLFLNGDDISIGLVEPMNRPPRLTIKTSNASLEQLSTSKSRSNMSAKKQPARGWIENEDGSIELVSYRTNKVNQSQTKNNYRGCQ